MFPQSPQVSSKEASTPSLDQRHAATRETVPQPRHVARLVFSATARPSQRCDVTAFHVRSPWPTTSQSKGIRSEMPSHGWLGMGALQFLDIGRDVNRLYLRQVE